MQETIENSDRLLQQASTLVNIGYWNMPDATVEERERSHETQRIVWALSAIARTRESSSPEVLEATSVVSKDLSRTLASHMHEAIASRRLNPNAVRDKDVLTYPTDGERLSHFGDRPAAQRMVLSERIADTVEDATAHGGAWLSGGTRENAQERSAARGGAVTIPFLVRKSAETPDLRAAYETTATEVAVGLSRSLRRNRGPDLSINDLKDPSALMSFYEEALSGVAKISTGTRGPGADVDAPMPVRQVSAGR